MTPKVSRPQRAAEAVARTAAVPQDAKDQAAAAKQAVLAALAELGHPIDARVDVRIDPKLAIMGYSRPVRGGYRVVVGPGAFARGMVAGLLAHELSHVQRMASGHPSHSQDAIQAAYDGIQLRGPQQPYMDEIVHDLINNIEDLYADGISFQVMTRLGQMPEGGIAGFFLGWMTDTPAPGADGRESAWRAMHALATNLRALAQMQGHAPPALLREGEAIQARLRHHLPPAVAKLEGWLRDVLADLPEDITDKAFAERLRDYVRRLVAAAES